MTGDARRKVFEEHLAGLSLGDADFAAVKKKLGEPARTLSEEKVTVFEYDDPKVKTLGRFKKLQCIFFDGLLLNVSYVEPDPKLARKKLHAALGAPDETPEDDEDDEDGLAEIFEVETDDEPLLSFAAHYDEDENLEALSLCAEMSDDLLDDEEEADGDEEGDADDDDDDAVADDAGDAGD
jgi:hypothetical protein